MIFLHKLVSGHNAAETTRNISEAFDEYTAQYDISSRNFVAEIWASKIRVPEDPKMWSTTTSWRLNVKPIHLDAEK